MNWILVLEIAVGIAIGIIVSVALRRSDLCFHWLIEFEPYSKRVCINFDINVELLKAVVERCKELGWDKKSID